MKNYVRLGVIICAAGRSARMGGADKLTLKLGGMTVLERCVGEFLKIDAVKRVLIASNRENNSVLTALFDPEKGFKGGEKISVCLGGDTRQQSVSAALGVMGDGVDYIAVHDGARPFVSPELILRTLEAAVCHGAAIPGLFARETIHVVRNGVAVATPERSELFCAQTPQVFKRELLIRAYAAAERDGISATDDAMLAARVLAPGESCAAVPGDADNIKITTPADISTGQRILGARGGSDCEYMRVGYGYDVHRLADGRRLILGGVEIPFEKGLLGHSDADVLLHAVIDALLGAAGERDIGFHFPDKGPEFKDVSSVILLEKARDIVKSAGYTVCNIDSTVVCQAPRLSGYIEAMREKIAETLGIARESVNIKGKTEEGLGFTGSGEGISAHAVCLLERI